LGGAPPAEGNAIFSGGSIRDGGQPPNANHEPALDASHKKKSHAPRFPVAIPVSADYVVSVNDTPVND
jgi:hypothetical protein